DTVLLIWDADFVAAVATTESCVREAETEQRTLQKVGEVEPERLPGCLAFELPLTAKAHQEFCLVDKKRRDWADQDGFGENAPATRLASICKAGVDCASNGRTIVLPEDLKDVERPDWSDHGSKRSRTSQRACGQLFRSQRKFPSCEEAEFLSADQLDLAAWSFVQLKEAVLAVVKLSDEFYEQKQRIQNRVHLCRAWRADLEKALFRASAAKAAPEQPEGLMGVAAYLVFLKCRTTCGNCAQKEAAQRALSAVEAVANGALEVPISAAARDVWRLFQSKVLAARSQRLHGLCPHKPEEPFLIDPVKLRFSHVAISCHFRSGLALEEAVRSLISGERKKRDFAKMGKPLPVRWHKGHWYTMGNRRLAIYRLLKFHLPEGMCDQVLVRRVNDAEALRWPWHRKFEQDEREGRSIHVRVIGETGLVIGETKEETTMTIDEGHPPAGGGVDGTDKGS
ncbi:Superkiller viralicidic activity 2-like 2, partial [Durusdinium trenchii]